MRATPIALLVVAACNPATPDIPWLHGLEQAASSTGVDVPRTPADADVAPNCGVAASRPVELVADVAPPAGRELIVGTYSSGLAVFDREDHLVAETPGYLCAGSADELDAIAVGTAYGRPLLAIAATTGGRRETATFVGLFHLVRGQLEPAFTGVVETRADDTIKRGTIYLFPGGLLYTQPDRAPQVYRLDPVSDVYLPPLPESHDEPDVAAR